MRGGKRRVNAVPTAAEKHQQQQQPVITDGVLDMAIRKGARCCVECGATSTPQWREGPMGPKTLCNACGVRRQRMLRKQQAGAASAVPTAPVAAVQARRRTTTARVAAQNLPSMLTDDDLHHPGTLSGSDHSSDETEHDWNTTLTPAYPSSHPRPAKPTDQHSQRPQRQPQTQPPSHDLEDSCNEEETAAYDLLFFAGVECAGGGSSGMAQAGDGLDEMDEAGDLAGGWRRSWPPHLAYHETGSDQPNNHGHNTRRHAHPVRRLEDFYYFDGDVLDETVVGVGSAGSSTSNKRRKVSPATAVHAVGVAHRSTRLAPGPSFASYEDAADKRSIPCSASSFKASPLRVSAPASSDVLGCPQLDSHAKLDSHSSEPPQLPIPPHASAEPPSPAGHPNLPPLSTCIPGVAAASAIIPPPPPSSFSPPTFSAGIPAAPAPTAPLPSLPPLAPLVTLPLTLPSLPLSLPLPNLSARDLEIIAKVQMDFQRACMQLQRANAACEAVSQVVEERREAAASAHQVATAASAQLAAGVRSLADQYRLRDVLAELHGVTTTTAPPAAAATAIPAPAAAYALAAPAVVAAEGAAAAAGPVQAGAGGAALPAAPSTP